MTAANSQVLRVRQPIFDHEQPVVGCELLCVGYAPSTDGED